VIPFRQNNKVRVAYSFSFARADKEADYPGGKGAWRGFLQNEVDQSAAKKRSSCWRLEHFPKMVLEWKNNWCGWVKKSKAWLPAIENNLCHLLYLKMPA